MLASFLRDEEGLVSVEYAVLLSLLLVSGILVWRHFGRHIRQVPRRLTRLWPSG
jgi:Flp pilus assembly pilin Flp